MWNREREIDKTLDEIYQETIRGIENFPDPSGLLAALVEEVGELARAMMSEPVERIRAEAIQVAALALRIVADGDPTLNGIRAKNNADNPIAPTP